MTRTVWHLCMTCQVQLTPQPRITCDGCPPPPTPEEPMPTEPTPTDAVRAAAAAASAHDPDGVAKLVEHYGFDATDPAGAVEQMRTERPYLFGDQQTSVADLRSMTPEQIVAAKDAGDLDHLLGIAPAIDSSTVADIAVPNFDSGARSNGSGQPAGSPFAQLSRDDIERMTPDQILTAKNNGQLDDLMGGRRVRP